MSFKVTRFAPTPSGFLHLGNLYSFLLTKAIAEQYQTKILLRIDDLDTDRVRDEYIQDIFDTLDFMEIGYDLGPKTILEQKNDWSQIHRLERYEAALAELKEKNLLFACDCSRKKIKSIHPDGHYLGYCLGRNISLSKSNCAHRFNTEDSEWLQVKELSGQVKTDSLPENSIFPIVKKRDGVAAYQLSSIVDDVIFGVDLIIRGRDLYPSTLTQLAIAENCESLAPFSKSIFHHHPLIKDQSGAKLSKSNKSTSIQYLRNEGKSKEQIYETLAQSLGWRPIDNLKEFAAELLKNQPLQK